MYPLADTNHGSNKLAANESNIEFPPVVNMRKIDSYKTFPPEIIFHILNFVIKDQANTEALILRCMRWRQLGRDACRIIQEQVRVLDVSSLFTKYLKLEEKKKPIKEAMEILKHQFHEASEKKTLKNLEFEKREQHVVKYLANIVKCFPNLEILNLNYCESLNNELLKILLHGLPKLREISLLNCFNITEFNCPQFNFRKISVENNVLLRCNILRQIRINQCEDTQILDVNQSFKVYIKNLLGKTMELYITNQDTVYDVKRLYGALTDIPADSQRYIFAGKRLCDEHTLEYYGVQKESTLHVVLRLRGGQNASITCSSVVLPTVMERSSSLERMNTCSIVHDKVESAETSSSNIVIQQLLFGEQYGSSSTLNVYEIDQMLDEEMCHRIVKDIVQGKVKHQEEDYKLRSSNLLYQLQTHIQMNILPQINSRKLFMNEKPLSRISDLFVVHYSPEQDDDLVLHIDDSVVTLNICVECVNCIGSEIEFLNLEAHPHFNTLDWRSELDLLHHSLEKQESSDTNSHSQLFLASFNHLQFYRVTPKKGKALLHSGRHPHQTLKIKSGERFNIVFGIIRKGFTLDPVSGGGPMSGLVGSVLLFGGDGSHESSVAATSNNVWMKREISIAIAVIILTFVVLSVVVWIVAVWRSDQTSTLNASSKNRLPKMKLLFYICGVGCQTFGVFFLYMFAGY
nr:unnamed protein product [Naegleria fowleri]